jgi:hypothetical protein
LTNALASRLQFCYTYTRDMRKTLKERFDEKWTPEPNTGCWLWTAYRNAAGYGTIRIKHKTYYAHRVAYELYIGPIPGGLWVLHKCNNGHLGCVDPDHLYAGTPKENARDAKNAGHYALMPSESPPHHILTEEQVLEIRNNHIGWTQRRIAKKYGVSQPAIQLIITRKTWKHI